MKFFTKLASLLFLLIASLHILRLAYGWQAEIGGWMVPFWLSSFAAALAVILVWGLWKESK